MLVVSVWMVLRAFGAFAACAVLKRWFELWSIVGFCVFFFSSRRRHTRSTRDWSSDVSSSDLRPRAARRARGQGRRRAATSHDRHDDVPRNGDDVLARESQWRMTAPGGASTQSMLDRKSVV